MTLLGLHLIDAIIVIAYLIAVLAIGQIASRRVKSEKDYLLGGRSLGKWFQFFLSFGTMADPSQATTTASSVYRQGAGGAWLALITLFLTPYYWFSCVWFRRVRLTTMADLFADRFGRKFLASLYAVTTVLMIVITIAAGNVVALKTLQPLLAKAPANYTAAEQQMVADYSQFVELRKARQAAPLAAEQAQRYDVLKGYYERGELQPYVTYLHPVIFYMISSAVVAVFVMLGGLKASAVVDAVQASLVIIISFVLIPFGLARIGGVAGLHAKVPAVLFNVFGGDSASEYTWYSIGALLLIQVVGIVGSQANMTIAGAAKNEMAARLGAVTGGFSKRFITIAWCYCGLIALALFGPNLADPDQTWGLMTRTLLPVGLIGLMIIGLLGGKLALLGAQSVVLSGLVLKNLYEPLNPGRSERHYMVVARLAVPIALGAGIYVALYLNSVIALLKFTIVLLVVWGAPITMIFCWRRVTEMAVRVQVIATLIFIAVIPWVVSATPKLAQSETLTQMTRERVVTTTVSATEADVAAGRAQTVGTTITKTRRIEPISLYFEEGVVRTNPLDPKSPRTGVGLFRVEVYLLSLCGVDVAGFSAAQLMTTRFVVDALFPLAILFVVSLLTKPTEPERVARFYARMKTPVAPTLEQDAMDVEMSYANPQRFEHTKLFPGTNWEFTKWNRQDAIGFVACWGLVILVIVVFKFVLTIGA
ncbi:transporter [Opitutus sp. ER46]|uniref:sodium:solute symporter family protein n=1 Tax=Opitutus sp. ER46 TaxID=2161864 RepID=UPI000D325068|nr:transporter [Opitutus sp. ER46]PTX94470.1 transporter [Opitutus sp. ER46]